MYSGLSPSFIVVDWWATESLYRHCHLPAGVDKRLSYRRETALQRDSFGQKWKTGTGRQYFTHIIGPSSTTVTKWASKAIEFGERTQNKGYYAVQGHSRSSRSVSIESPCATVINDKTSYLVLFRSYRSLLSSNFGNFVFLSLL